MRKPTPHDELWAWHRAAIRGERQPTHEGEPQCGYYLTRLEARGAFVPGSIWMEQHIDPETGELTADEILHAEIMGEEQDPIDAWMFLAKRPCCKLFYLQKLGEMF